MSKYFFKGQQFSSAKALEQYLQSIHPPLRQQLINLLPKELGHAYALYLNELCVDGAPGKPSQTVVLCHYPRSKPLQKYSNAGGTALSVRFDNIKEMLARFFLETHYDHGGIGNWRERCIGITSFTPDSLHMPMLEYDGRNVKKIIRQEVKKFQEKYNLGIARVYKTRRGGHVYFPTDTLPWAEYSKMLIESQCCEGFKHMSIGKGYSVLRVSAKYTQFDITHLEYLPAKAGALKRAHIVGVTAAKLIEMGQECGTHIAALYPQWAHYQEDISEWKLGKPKKAAPQQHAVPQGGLLKETCQITPEPASMIKQKPPPPKTGATYSEYMHTIEEWKKKFAGEQPPAHPHPAVPKHPLPPPPKPPAGMYSAGTAQWASTTSYTYTVSSEPEKSNFQVSCKSVPAMYYSPGPKAPEPEEVAVPTPEPEENPWLK